jgi:hypothetical protein
VVPQEQVEIKQREVPVEHLAQVVQAGVLAIQGLLVAQALLAQQEAVGAWEAQAVQRAPVGQVGQVVQAVQLEQRVATTVLLPRGIKRARLALPMQVKGIGNISRQTTEQRRNP